MAWSSSDRRAHLPKNWQQLRRRVFIRDGHQCTAIDPNTGLRCPEAADEVDHLGHRDDHRLEKLAAICSWHHKQRTAAQAGAARARAARERDRKFRRTEEHPGLT
jgi:5-methylcytosine-specific restriction protein A